MEMVRHEYIGDQFAGPFFIELLELSKESLTACWISENRLSIEEVSGDVMESTRNIEVGPFFEPCEEAP
jgi:hypothetical protein